MKILVYTPMVGRSGVHRVVEKLTHALACVGSEHTFHVLGQQFDEIGEMVRYPPAWGFTQIEPVEKLPPHPHQFPFLVNAADRFFSHLKRLASGYDVIWCPVIWWTMRVSQTWELPCPLVVTVQDFAFDMIDMGILAQHFREVSYLTAKRADITIFTSDFQREHGGKTYGFKNTRVIRHSGDFVPDNFNPTAEEILRVKVKYNLPDAGYVLAFHPMHHKDPITILRGQHYARSRSPTVPPLVFAGVNTQHLVSNGAPNDQHITGVRQVLQEMTVTPGQDFFALGFIPDEDIAGLYAGATCSITASRSEGDVPGNILEAARARTPVIYSDFPVLTERLGNYGQYGICFRMGDYGALGRALIDVCEHPELARERATTLFGYLNERTVDDVARDYLAVFDEAVNGAKQPKVDRQTEIVQRLMVLHQEMTTLLTEWSTMKGALI